jgi:hypothetical protein
MEGGSDPVRLPLPTTPSPQPGADGRFASSARASLGMSAPKGLGKVRESWTPAAAMDRFRRVNDFMEGI